MPFILQGKLTIDLAPLGRLRKGRAQVLRVALDKGTQAMTKRAKGLCPVSEAPPLIAGLLKKSYGRRIKVYRGTVLVMIGARTGFRKVVGQTRDGKSIVQDPTKYDHFSELGTVREAPQPHLRPAFDGEKTAAEETVRRELMAGVERALAKGMGL